MLFGNTHSHLRKYKANDDDIYLYYFLFVRKRVEKFKFTFIDAYTAATVVSQSVSQAIECDYDMVK